MRDVPEFAGNWLKCFARAVREQDFAAGKKLFQPASISFGTVCRRSEDLDELVVQQWQIVWPNSRDFDFDYTSARATVAENLAVIIAGWQSTGFDKNQIPSQRRGRATVALQKTDAGWLAVHSHFSITPTLSYDPILCHAPSRTSRSRIS